MITFSDIGNYGRLGNQLFQIAAAISLAKRNNDSAQFYNWKYAKYFKTQIDQSLKIEFIKHIYNEPFFHFSDIPYSNGLDIKGYFQSEKYFSDNKQLIKEYFEFNDILDPVWDSINKDCSIHSSLFTCITCTILICGNAILISW